MSNSKPEPEKLESFVPAYTYVTISSSIDLDIFRRVGSRKQGPEVHGA